MTAKFILYLSVTVFGLSGCANINSISRTHSIPGASDGSVFTVDAKQRHLVMSRVNNQGDSRLRVCAEAAPDVFSAFATSAAAQGNNSGGQFSLSSAETAATIERTQTINMLRESFYRTCERYLSGAINESQFTIQAARDQRSMIAILAIEQLTGAVRPSSTILSPGGTAASVLSGEKAAELIRDYDQRLAQAKAAKQNADKAVLDAQTGVCSSEDGKSKPNECQALEAEATKTAKDVEDAQKALDNVLAIAKDLVSAGTASTTAGTTLQGGGVEAARFEAARMTAVSRSVVDIVKLASIDEPLMFCLSQLTDRNLVTADAASNGGAITTACIDILKFKTQQDGLTVGQAGFSARELSRAYAEITPVNYDIWKLRLMEKIQRADTDQLASAGFARVKAALGIGTAFLDCTTKDDCIEAIRNAPALEQRWVAIGIRQADSALNAFDGGN